MERMRTLIECLLIRANSAKKESDWNARHGSKERKEFFAGMYRAYTDSINEIGCRLSPMIEVAHNGMEFITRERK